MGKRHQVWIILVCSAKSTRGWRSPINKYSFGTVLCCFLYCFTLSNMPRQMVSEIQKIQRSQQKLPAKETAVWIIQGKAFGSGAGLVPAVWEREKKQQKGWECHQPCVRCRCWQELLVCCGKSSVPPNWLFQPAWLSTLINTSLWCLHYIRNKMTFTDSSKRS